MARRRRPGARAAARAARSPLLLGACSALVVGVVTIIASCSSSIASASAQATTASASASPPPPFDPTVGWPSSGVRTLDVTLPPAETVEDEEYLCTSVPLPEGIPLGLTRVEPLASAAVVHHILLFGEWGSVKSVGSGWEKEDGARKKWQGYAFYFFGIDGRCRDVRPLSFDFF